MRQLKVPRRLRRPAAAPQRDARWQVGGMWEEIGKLQFDFLVGQGLMPEDRLLDVGCGSLRGGVHFARYLEAGRYHGLDIDERLLDAGREELARAGLVDRGAKLIADEAFSFGRFDERFSYALAQSVFTHLPLNTIMRCLGEMEKVLVDGGRFYATFFLNHGPRLNLDRYQETQAITTFPDADPYYYDPDAFRWAVEGSTLRCELLGEWGHPRHQQMLLFTKAG